MKFRNLDTKEFEYFCSRAVLVIGILILGFLSFYGLHYTEEFESNHAKILTTTQTSVIGMLVWIALAAGILYWAGKLILKNERHRKRNIRILLILPVHTQRQQDLHGPYSAIIIRYGMSGWFPFLRISSRMELMISVRMISIILKPGLISWE